MKENKKASKGSIIYAVVGVCTLIIAVVGATYAYYAASATAEISGTAGGGNAPTLAVVEASNIENNPLIPVNMVKETLDNAAKGWDTSTNDVGTSWNAANACKDMNGYSVCKIYSVTLTNNSSSSVKYKIELTSLAGTETPDNTPNVKAVAMGTSKTEVTSIDPIVGVEAGIAANVQLAGKAQGSTANVSSTFYFMVFIENKNVPQTDVGSFTGTVTAIGGDGGRIEAQFD